MPGLWYKLVNFGATKTSSQAVVEDLVLGEEAVRVPPLQQQLLLQRPQDPLQDVRALSTRQF